MENVPMLDSNDTPSHYENSDSGNDSTATGAAYAANSLFGDTSYDAPEGNGQAVPPNSTSSPAPDTAVAAVEPAEVVQAAWDQAMDVLQTELSAPAYNNYLRHIKPLKLQGDRLTLGAPSDFVKDWLV